MPCVGEVEGDHGGFESGVPQGALDEAAVDTGFEERGGVGRPERMHGQARFGDPSTVCGFAEGALDAISPHGFSGGRALVLIAPGGGQEPGLVAVGCPVGRRRVRVSAGRGTERSVAPLPRWTWTWRRWPSMSATCRERASWSRSPRL
jgi:hypothetical protein